MQTIQSLWTEWDGRLAEISQLMSNAQSEQAESLRMGMYDIEATMRRLRAPRGVEVASATIKLKVAMHYAREQERPGEKLDPNWQLVESALCDLQAAEAPLS